MKSDMKYINKQTNKNNASKLNKILPLMLKKLDNKEIIRKIFYLFII